MSGGGNSSPPPAPSTTTQIQDVPAWEQGYLTNLLGQAQTIAQQPYQQYPGQQVAGFTPAQTQSFNNVENLPNIFQPTQNAGVLSALTGANTVGNIYGAASPLIGAATQAASPQGISAYMSPYIGNVVQGIQNEANQNWNQNIMPSVNDAFISAGQFGSGRNAQVLGQAANNFQTNLSANIANALESGYGMAGQQAGQQANTLLNAGNSLGNLAATQGEAQLGAGTTLGNLGGQQLGSNLTAAQALQAVGQQQQQLNQTNLNTAQQNWQNQVSWPTQQTEYLSGIIRGLPAMGSATTSATQQTPLGVYNPSPLSGIGGAGIGGLSLLGNNGQSVGTLSGAKMGGLIKGYAEGGEVDDEILPNGQNDAQIADTSDGDRTDFLTQIVGGGSANAPARQNVGTSPITGSNSPLSMGAGAASNPLALLSSYNTPQMDEGQVQRAQILAIAKGLLSPTHTGSPWESLGTGLGGANDIGMEATRWNAEQQAKQAPLALEAARLGQTGQYQQQELAQREKENLRQNEIERERLGISERQLEMGKYSITPDQMGSFLKINNKTGEVEKIPSSIGGETPVDKDGNPLTGNTYLSTLPPARAALIKRMSEGDYPIPTGYQATKPVGQMMLQQLYTYDPEASSQTAPAVKAFLTGTEGKTLRSMNASTEHLGTLEGLVNALGNGDVKGFNLLSNAVASQFGKPAPTNFDTAKQVVSDEVMKSILGTGAGSQAERQALEANFSKANSPEQLKGAIETAKGLMGGQLDALRKQYEDSTHKRDFENRLTPGALNIYKQHQQTVSATPVISGQSAAAAPKQPMTAMPDAMQHPGRTIRDTATGKRFKSDGKNWNPV